MTTLNLSEGGARNNGPHYRYRTMTFGELASVNYGGVLWKMLYQVLIV